MRRTISGAACRPPSPQPYNAQSSGGSNLGPTNPALADEIKGRINALKAADTDISPPVPVDLVTSSGSGLDPEISPAAAAYQAARVAKARGLHGRSGQRTGRARYVGRQFGILGEARVNVLKLNLALDAALKRRKLMDRRPDPDELLDKIQRDEERKAARPAEDFLRRIGGRGEDLCHVAGRAPAPGGRVDTVVGIVETHGRKETLALVEGLELCRWRVMSTAAASSRVRPRRGARTQAATDPRRRTRAFERAGRSSP